MSKLLDMLLSEDCPNVLRKPPEKQVEIVSLSQRLGKKAVFTIRALPYGRVQELRRMDNDSTNLHIVLNGCAEPDWRDERLLNKDAGILTPLDAIQSRLLSGEIAELALEIERLSGFRMSVVREVKNA